ncbi:MAG: hypothetical protein H6657_09855 [Ardenticatenaceae bacterium]|nr:hypothetical protein [Ardenticatenaceae bacterium]
MIHRKLSLAKFRRLGRHKAGVFALLLLLLFFGVGTVSSSPFVIPTISVSSVQAGKTVTIQTHNFPPNMTFNVTMGKMYTQGIGGISVGQINSGNGASQSVTFDIPAALANDAQVSIRAQTGHANPYYAFNWFYNNNSAPVPVNPAPIYTGIPTFSVSSVNADKDVTIVTNNFPANMTFNVTMGKMYTRGIGGISVGTIESGSGGTLTKTFTIPAELAGDERISIRAQTAHANPFYAFNWFYNVTAGATGGGTTTGSTGSSVPVYTGIPTFSVCGVTRDNTVTIKTYNFPPNQAFAVTMGPMFTQGIGGYSVGTIASGSDSSAEYSFPIPAELHGSYRISIRAQTGHAYPYYAYNWFYNNTTSATVKYCP